MSTAVAGSRLRSSTPATCIEARALVRRPAQSLRLAAASLLLKTALLGRRARLGRPPPALDLQRFSERFDDTLARELAIAPLTALVLGDGPDDRACFRDHAALLSVSEP